MIPIKVGETHSYSPTFLVCFIPKTLKHFNSLMKQTVALLFISLVVGGFPTHAQVTRLEQKAAYGVIKRTYPELASRLSVGSMPVGKAGNTFEQKIRKGKLLVNGSSATAICRGVYDFVR